MSNKGKTRNEVCPLTYVVFIILGLFRRKIIYQIQGVGISGAKVSPFFFFFHIFFLLQLCVCVYVCIQNVDETQRNKHAIWEMKFPECDSLVQCPKGNNKFSTVYWSGSEHWPKMLLLLWWTTRKNAETCSLLFKCF